MNATSAPRADLGAYTRIDGRRLFERRIALPSARPAPSAPRVAGWPIVLPERLIGANALARALAAGEAPRHGVVLHLGHGDAGVGQSFARLALPATVKPETVDCWAVVSDLDTLIDDRGTDPLWLAAVLHALVDAGPRSLTLTQRRGDRIRSVPIVTLAGVIRRSLSADDPPWQHEAALPEPANRPESRASP